MRVIIWLLLSQDQTHASMTHQFRPVAEQVEILMRGVDCGDVQTQEAMQGELTERLAQSLHSGQPLRVYCGFDPSRADLHLGHTVPLRKLRQFQDLGHEVVFLIGTFTGIIGDPSDKESAREQQTLEESMQKAETFAIQAFRVLDKETAIVDYNHRWLQDLTFADVIEVASLFTVQQFLTRQNFRMRLEKGDPIWLHEFFYALMQAFDAYALKTDVQIGGTDQLFNLMAGRKLMQAKGLRPQTVLTYPILPGLDGVKRMSKSTGNTIDLEDSPGKMFTKILNLPDTVIPLYCDLLTRWESSQLAQVHARFEDDMPTVKRELAREIVSAYHGDSQVASAEQDAAHMFSGVMPSDTPEFPLTENTSLLDVLHTAGLIESKGRGRRLVQQGGVRLDGKTVTDPFISLVPEAGTDRVVQIGKTMFLKLTS